MICIGVGIADHPTEERVIVIEYAAQIIPNKEYNQMLVEDAKIEEELASGFDTSGIDFEALGKAIVDEINKVRENPKTILKTLEKSLSSF